MDIERNIFDAASKKLRKEQKKPASSDQPAAISSEKNKQKGYGDEDPEVVEMFVRIREMKRDLETNMNELRKKGDSFQIDVDRFIENTINTFPGEYDKLKQKEQAFLEKANSLLTPESGLKKVPKTKDQLTHERKGKTLGARKKWIPMR